MDLNIFIVLFFTLLSGVHSLKCYECAATASSCVSKETTCASALTTCVSATALSTIGDATVTLTIKSCGTPQGCVNGSVNFGISRTAMSAQCCNTDLCNSKDVPDSSSNNPNGKQCFYCDGKSCSNKLNCGGTEDYCIKATTNTGTQSATVKGCVSKSFCDAASQALQGFTDVSCCQGNLCNNAKSITHSLLLLSWPFFFYILFH